MYTVLCERSLNVHDRNKTLASQHLKSVTNFLSCINSDTRFPLRLHSFRQFSGIGRAGIENSKWNVTIFVTTQSWKSIPPVPSIPPQRVEQLEALEEQE